MGVVNNSLVVYRGRDSSADWDLRIKGFSRIERQVFPGDKVLVARVAVTVE